VRPGDGKGCAAERGATRRGAASSTNSKAAQAGRRPPMSAMNFYSIAADAVLLLHLLFVLFVVGGLIVIWAGYFCGWRFVRNFYFRMAHLVAIGIVVGESITGIFCPLTRWEERLRMLAGQGASYEGSFMQHWIHRIMFFELEESTFTLIYIGFFLAVIFSFWLVRPERPARR
jgi:hypothetical protein